MKCPKCNYTSFETNDSCPKCSNSLIDFRQTHGITPLIFSPKVKAEMAASIGGIIEVEPQATDNSSDMFSFDIANHAEKTVAEPAAPFSFQKSQEAPGGPAPAFSFDTETPVTPHDPFSELLENATSIKQSVTAPKPASTQGQGYELNSFSWDDTPEPAQANSAEPAKPAKQPDDDFSSLFGDMASSGQQKH